jgi:hypothetical protein
MAEKHAGYKGDDVSYGVELAEAWMEDVDEVTFALRSLTSC